MRLNGKFVYCPKCGSGKVVRDQEFPDHLQCDNCLTLAKEERFNYETYEQAAPRRRR